MLSSRAWLVALAVASLGVLGILLLAGTTPARFATGAAIVVAYAVVFLLLRRRTREGNGWALAMTIVTVVYAGAVAADSPSLAFIQFFAFPVVWTLAGNVRGGLIASAAVAASVGVGFWFSIGDSEYRLAQVLTTAGLSFGFSAVMGLWIARVTHLGQEKARLFDELTAAQDELAVLHRDAGTTAERARMSREVHDTVAQSLTGLVLLAQRARRDFAAGALADETLELIESGARDGLAETRALVAAAAPVELSNGGLPEALARLAERFERETRIRVTVSTGAPHPLPRDSEVALLRCAQEGLANVRKHSAAAHARVELSVVDGEARLRVSDDGRGFPAEVHAGFGLAGLRDRLALAGGSLEVDGTPGATSITAMLPLGVDA